MSDVDDELRAALRALPRPRWLTSTLTAAPAVEAEPETPSVRLRVLTDVTPSLLAGVEEGVELGRRRPAASAST